MDKVLVEGIEVKKKYAKKLLKRTNCLSSLMADFLSEIEEHDFDDCEVIVETYTDVNNVVHILNHIDIPIAQVKFK